jgi:deoxycytidine triphosphate deaminase
MSDTAGAVLCKEEILERCAADQARPLIRDFEEDQVHGAKYDLRMAKTGMVLPNGTVVRADSRTPYTGLILLAPGQTVFVSTREQLHMPRNLVGNMSIKGDLSREGILSLTGLIVDPGFTTGPSGDGRLHFRLANLGPRSVALKPGETAVASIQFLPLAEKTDPVGPVPNVWDDPQSLKEGLGFIEDLNDLQREVTGLRRDFEAQRRSVEIVVAAAIGLILATLLGVAVSALLSLGANSDLVEAAGNVIPDDARGQWLFVLALFGLGAIMWAIVVGWARGRRPLIPVPVGHRRNEHEAFRDLAVSRTRRVCGGVAAAGLATWGSVAIAMEVFEATTAVDVVVGVVVATAAAWAVLTWAWDPITQSDVDGRLKEWQEGQ